MVFFPSHRCFSLLCAHAAAVTHTHTRHTKMRRFFFDVVAVYCRAWVSVARGDILDKPLLREVATSL